MTDVKTLRELIEDINRTGDSIEREKDMMRSKIAEIRSIVEVLTGLHAENIGLAHDDLAALDILWAKLQSILEKGSPEFE